MFSIGKRMVMIVFHVKTEKKEAKSFTSCVCLQGHLLLFRWKHGIHIPAAYFSLKPLNRPRRCFFFFSCLFSAATLYNLCELVVEFKKAVSRPCCLFVFTSCCCFHCLFSHLQALFSANPPSSLAGAARPTSHSKPNTEKEPTGSQVELLLLDVFLQPPRPESKSILFRK